MKAVVMAGGFGTRIQPLTSSVPKPMLPVINRPMMEYIFEQLKNVGITEIVVLLYFKPEVIQGYFGDGSDFGVQLQYVIPDDDYGTAGAVKQAEKFLDEPFIIISGDLISDFKLQEIIGFHDVNQSKVTITLTSVEDPLQFGVVITDKENKIIRFLEKPGWGEVFSDTINTGIYVFDPEILKYIPDNAPFDFSKDLFPKLMSNDVTLYGYNASGYWRDVGNPNSYRESLVDILEGKVSVPMDLNEIAYESGSIFYDEEAKVAEDVTIEGTVVLGKNVTIESGAYLKNSVIGSESVISKSSRITESILWDHVTVGKNCLIHYSVLCNQVVLGRNIHAKNGCIISENTEVGNYVVFEKDVMVWPNKQIEEESIVSSNLIWGDKWKKTIFEGGKVSARTNVELSAELSAKLGTALGSVAPKGCGVLLSRDYHRASRMVKRGFLAGLLAAGINAVDLRMAPLPVMRFILGNHKELFGVHFRQSPDDPTHTEILFYDENGLPTDANMEKNIERFFFRENFRRVPLDDIGNITDRHGLTQMYQNSFYDYIDADKIRSRHFRVVVDLLNGTTDTLYPKILNDLNIEATVLNAYHDEKKLSRTYSKIKETLNQSVNIMKSLKADIGFVLYPHGERLQIISDKGELLKRERALMLFLKLIDLTATEPVKVFLPATSPTVLDAELKNVQITRGKSTGLKPEFLKSFYFYGTTECLFSFPQFSPGVDGLYCSTKLLEMLARVEMNVSDIVEAFPEYYFMHNVINCPVEKKGFLMRKMSEEAIDKQASFVDGIKIEFRNKGWVLMIPDQYSPNVHLYVEAVNEDKGREILEEYKKKINDWLEE